MADNTATTPEAKPEGGKEPEAKTPEADKTFTQADLDRHIEERLTRERKKYEGHDELKAKAAQFDELSEKDKTELEKLAGKVAKSEQARAEAEAKLTRYEVAAEKKIPPQLVPLLTAATKEELEKQADLILENAKEPAPNFDGGAREAAPEPKTPEQAHNETLLHDVLGIPRQT